jgi:hypothetical protein
MSAREAFMGPPSGKDAKVAEEIIQERGGDAALQQLGFPQIVVTKPDAGRGGAQGAFDKLLGNTRTGMLEESKVPSRRLEVGLSRPSIPHPQNYSH